MKKCFVFGALKTEKLPIVPSDGDLIIAADKGLESVKGLSLNADMIIGDFDSLGYVPKGKDIELLPVRKDDTDVGYAINKGLSMGYKSFVVYGCLGGALDHTLANIQLAAAISKRGGRAVFIGDNTYLTAITNGTLSVENGRGRISVFASFGKAKGVTLKGLDYSLDNAVITEDFPIGVGNHFKEKSAYISVENGTLIIISEYPVSV